jgi:hypothetical protein
MPRKTAGYRYPHATTDARRHDHRMCAVIQKIAERAASGTEDWGTPHRLPPLDTTEAQAEEIRDQLFNGRNCRRVARAAGGPLSVSVTFLTPDGQLANSPAVRRPEGYILIVRVWQRGTSRLHIAARVENGERLPYNPLRGNTP